MTQDAPNLAPPGRPLSARAFDILIWGGVAILLIISFGPAEIFKFPQLFGSEGMQQFVAGFFSPLMGRVYLHTLG